jgi:hypothetical protein
MLLSRHKKPTRDQDGSSTNATTNEFTFRAAMTDIALGASEELNVTVLATAHAFQASDNPAWDLATVATTMRMKPFCSLVLYYRT